MVQKIQDVSVLKVDHRFLIVNFLSSRAVLAAVETFTIYIYHKFTPAGFERCIRQLRIIKLAC